MSEVKHTPLPWVYNKNRHTHDSPIHRSDAVENDSQYIGGEEGGVVGSSEWIWLSDENGEFIVRACNSHYELISALEHAERYLSVQPIRDILEYRSLMERMKNVLSKAKDAP